MSIFDALKAYETHQISYAEFKKELEDEAQKNNLSEKDALGNTILHRIIQSENAGTSLIKLVLKLNPSLANEDNDRYQLPSDLLYDKETEQSNAPLRPLKRLLIQYMADGPVKKGLQEDISIHFGRRDIGDLPHNFKTLEPNEVNLMQPTLLCFSGINVNNPKMANGFAKIVKYALGALYAQTKDIQVLSAWYPGSKMDMDLDRVSWKTGNLENDEDTPLLYVKEMVDHYFKPLYSKDGHRIPIQQAKKNMRHLNIVSYSYGSSVVQMAAQLIRQDLKSLGYSEKEVVDIQRQVFSFTLGGDVNHHAFKNDFTAYHLINGEDNIIHSMVADLVREEYGFSEDGIRIAPIKGQPHQTAIVVDKIPLNDVFKEQESLLENSQVTDMEPHDCTTYLFNGLQLKQQFLSLFKMSVITNALNNSIENARTDKFIPLAADLTQIPNRALFLKNIEDKQKWYIDIQQRQKKIPYQEMLKEAQLTPETSFLKAQRIIHNASR